MEFSAITLSILHSIDARELRFARAMIFAIEEINNSTKLLPGIKLGYQIYDSCASVLVSVNVAFQLSNGQDLEFYKGSNCSQSGVVMAVVGESGSTPSISMSRIFGSFSIPLVRTVCIYCLEINYKSLLILPFVLVKTS